MSVRDDLLSGSDLNPLMQDSVTKESDQVSAKELTKQMLMNCKVYRKRNTNVTPIRSRQGSNVRRMSPINYFSSVKQSQIHDYEDPNSVNQNIISTEKLT